MLFLPVGLAVGGLKKLGSLFGKKKRKKQAAAQAALEASEKAALAAEVAEQQMFQRQVQVQAAARGQTALYAGIGFGVLLLGLGIYAVVKK